MRYKLLGRSGLRVSEFCLGSMIAQADVNRAHRLGVAPAHVAVRWTQRNLQVIPIIGGRTFEQM